MPIHQPYPHPAYFVLLLLIVPLLIAGFKLAKELRRKKLRSLPFNPEWSRFLEKNLPLYRILPEHLKNQLQSDIQVFIHEKNFEGCGGLALTEVMKALIAAQACVLMLNRKPTYYPRLISILVYPSAFIARNIQSSGGYLVDKEIHLGESWRTGVVILSWDEIVREAHDPLDGHNVALHEFAHQLDQENGVSDGTPILPRRSRYISWARVLGKEFEQLQNDASHGTKTLMDYYGTKNPAEFFAVATETFFEKPLLMQRKHPDLYNQLKDYFQLDPATWISKDA